MISEELKKMFEGRIEMQYIHYVGKACYGRLEENLRGRLSWARLYGQWVYQAYRLGAGATNGLVDQMKFFDQ